MLKRITAAALAALCLCGCGMNRITVEKSVKEYETDYSSVHAETITISGMKNEEFQDGINNQIAKDIESGIVAFDTDASASEENVRMGNKCVYEDYWDEKYNGNDFLSLIEERYIYFGGAHGQTVRLPRNIDIAVSKEVQLKDLFEDSGYVTTLNRMINELIAQNSDEYSDLWEKPEIKDTNQTDFYIENGKLVIFYQPYDLSYYARGFVEFPLPLEDLSGYLKEEYRRLVLNGF